MMKSIKPAAIALAALSVAGCGEILMGSKKDPAAQPIEGDAASAWVEMMGVWAPAGACGDYTQEWRIEGEAFHLHEMHCKIERLELLQNGVRAIAHCSVEGDDDRVEDAFKFIRRPDATLSIVNEANEAKTDGLQMCGDDLP
jgi:hypothetical protein